MNTPTPTVADSRVPPRGRARIGAYAWWQLRDYAWERGLPTLLVAGLFGFLAAQPVRAVAERHGSVLVASTHALRGFVGSVVFLGALFAMNGLVANDRKQGFYRFLFTRPLTPSRYYGQAFVLHAVGFFVILLLLGAAWGALIAPALSRDLVLAMWLVYLCYAGLAFLLTAAARYDWLSLVAVSVAAQLLWGFYGQSTHVLARLLYLLPPLAEIDPVYEAATMHQPLPWRTLAWLAGYGVACFAAGLVVLRYRRLATP